MQGQVKIIHLRICAPGRLVVLPLFTAINFTSPPSPLRRSSGIMYQIATNMSATDFHRFSSLPLELRIHIWEDALPGPRIVYIQCVISPELGLNRTRKQFRPGSASVLRPFYLRSPSPTTFYFRSPSPITSLLSTCAESRHVARKRYQTLYSPSPTEEGNCSKTRQQLQLIYKRMKNTWFDFERDYLYLEWGTMDRYGPNTLPYALRNFQPYSPPHNTPSTSFVPLAGSRIAEVQKLIIHNSWFKHTPTLNADQLLRDILHVFQGVGTCVLADQLLVQEEQGEWLEWLFGESVAEEGQDTDDDLELEQMQQLLKEAGKQWGYVKNSVMSQKYHQAGDVSLNLHTFSAQWNKDPLTKDRRIPNISRQIVTTSAIKAALLLIFGSDKNFKHLELYTWLRGEDWICLLPGLQDSLGGPLDFSQHIALLELVLSRVPLASEEEVAGQDYNTSGMVQCLLERIDNLIVEREMRHLLESEAEETG